MSDEYCSCTTYKRFGSYVPDTPTISIDRKVQEDQQRASECQKIWKSIKKDGDFQEPAPIGFGVCTKPVEKEEEEPPESDSDWCESISSVCRRKCPQPAMPEQYDNDCQAGNCQVQPLYNSQQGFSDEVRDNNNLLEPPTKLSPVCLLQQSSGTDLSGLPELKLAKVANFACTPSVEKSEIKELDCKVSDKSSTDTGNGGSSEKEKPGDKECQIFMKFASGQTNFQKRDLYDPQNKMDMKNNIKSCLFLGSGCFQKFDEVAEGNIDEKGCPLKSKQQQEYQCKSSDPEIPSKLVDERPEGCCDYRSSSLSPALQLPADDFECPPMPNTVDLIIKPGWLECPAKMSVPPYPAPVGAKIKPISKGIRTNFERNPNCLTCGAKRKPAAQKKCMKHLNKNSPAMAPRCEKKIPVNKSTSLVDQIIAPVQSVASKLGIKW